MKEAGEVVKIEDGRAHLVFNRTSACSKCGACGMIAGKSSVTVEAQNTLGAKEGDRVELEFSTKNAMKSSLIAYIFPLAMLLLGVLIGYYAPQTVFETKDVFAAILGIVFAAAAFVVIKLLNPLFKKKLDGAYNMVRIVDGE